MQIELLAFRRTADQNTGHRARVRPIVVANPPTDRAFRSMIDRFLATEDGLPEELEHVLRGRYPEAVVRRRELAAERVEVWYAYRDGHWVRSEPDAVRG